MILSISFSCNDSVIDEIGPTYDRSLLLSNWHEYHIVPLNKNFKKDVKITDFTKHLTCLFKGYIGSKHTRAFMCHELNFEKYPLKKLEELLFKEDLWINGPDLYSKVI